MDFLKNMVKVVGSIFATVILFGIPIMATLSFIYKWSGIFKILFLLSSAVVFVCVFAVIYVYADD